MTDKVIEFPKNKVVRDVPEEHLKARQAKADQKLAETIVDDIAGIIVTELDNFMVDVQDKDFAKDFILVVDALKACVFRSFGINHHLHGFIDKNVTIFEHDVDNMSREEIREKIDSIMKELVVAKSNLDADEED